MSVEELALGLANVFQCSSASRKFLKTLTVLEFAADARVSVLFSEPKIPQYCTRWVDVTDDARFSALQRAENSSMVV